MPTRPKTQPPSTSPADIVEARFAAAAKANDQIPPPAQLELAFVGRSNVGKSSLLNAMMHRRNLVRTSSTPGCTRAVGFFEVRTRGNAHATLVDLPGYGYAKRSKTEREEWGTLIDHYLLERPTLAVVAMLVDVRRGLREEELELLKMLREPARVARRLVHVTVAATKVDQLKLAERTKAISEIKKQSGAAVHGVSVREPASTDAFWRMLCRQAGLGTDTKG